MNLVRRNSDWASPVTIDRFFDRFFNESTDQTEASFTPSVDIAESSKAFEIQLAVPGLDKKDISIDLRDGLLTISGERKFVKEDKDRNFYAVQTQYGTFKKSFQLPDSVEEAKIEATYNNGILNVVVPKDESKKIVSKITVK
ncbi:Hsp20/alpha crystallin family protein [Roseivirga sp.]|uniref:Hsp20/alpha crystallin family protein n=1 Tax=Roseivirga sp. TaxID=1964215 RepID=UPI003B8D01DC